MRVTIERAPEMSKGGIFSTSKPHPHRQAIVLTVIMTEEEKAILSRAGIDAQHFRVHDDDVSMNPCAIPIYVLFEGKPITIRDCKQFNLPDIEKKLEAECQNLKALVEENRQPTKKTLEL